MLNEHVKRFIKRSISELGINDLKNMVEWYGASQMDKALKIIDRIRIKRGLVLKTYYANCTCMASNYYRWNAAELQAMGYVQHLGMWCLFKTDTLH